MPPDPIDDLLTECLDQPASAHLGYLETLCEAHPDLAPELRRRFHVLVETGIVDAPVEEHGQLGPFRLQRRLGRGGMGVVYLAEDSVLGRQVALKLIHADLLDSPRARERFRREAEAAAKLDHPGICTVYGAGEIDCRPYLALQYLEGETCYELLRDARARGCGALGGRPSGESTPLGSIPVRAADLRQSIKLTEQLARAVHTAHEAGLVHRDIKPANIMITEARPVLMDFGLVRNLASSGASLTQSTDVIGTPAYMAPEQIRKGEPVDRRTDVYALGALLYECLTLRPPFVGANREELYRAILTEDPVELTRLQPAASRDLATVVHKALTKEPKQRYAGALALANDLRAILDDRPIKARRPGLVRRARKWAQRHRTLAVAIVTLLLGLASSLLLLGRMVDAERDMRALAAVTRVKVVAKDPDSTLEILRSAFQMSRKPEVVSAINEQLPERQLSKLVDTLNGPIQRLLSSPSGRWFLASTRNKETVVLDHEGCVHGVLPFSLPQTLNYAFSPDENEVMLIRDLPGVPRYGPVRCRLDGKQPSWHPFPSGKKLKVNAASVAWGPEHIVVIYTKLHPWYDPAPWAEVYTSDETAKPVGTAPDGSPRWSFGLTRYSLGAAVLADGRIALADGIHDLASGQFEPFHLPDLAEDPVTYLHPAGESLMIGSLRGIRTRDPDGTLHDYRRPARGPETWLNAFDVSDEGTIAASFLDGLVQRIDAQGGVEAWREPGSICQVEIAPNDERILVGSRNGLVTIHDRRGVLLTRWRGHRELANACWLQDGSGRVLTASWDNEIKVWTPGVFSGLPWRTGFGRAVLQVVGELLVVHDDEGRLLAIDAEGNVVSEARSGMPGVTSLSRHLDGQSVWVGTFDREELRAWNPRTGFDETTALELGFQGMTSLAHCAGGQLLMGVNLEDKARLFDLSSGEGKLLGEIRTSSVAAAPDGSIAVSIDTEGLLRVHDGTNPEKILWQNPDPAFSEFGESEGRPTGIAIDNRGVHVVIGHTNGVITVLDLKRRTWAPSWTDLGSAISAIAVSPDGSHVAGVTKAGHVVVYEMERKKPVLLCRLPGESFISVAFFADAVVTGPWRSSGILRYWWWDPDQLEARLEQLSESR